MPIFEFLCAKCGAISEVLVTSSNQPTACRRCGSTDLKKLLSATSAVTGTAKRGLPGPTDTTCCGSSPAHSGCAGPGSCCGKNSF